MENLCLNLPQHPTPYYSDKDITLYKGDCIEIMKGLPSQSVDLIFADPPYKLSNGGFTCNNGRRVKVDKGDWDKSKGLEEDHKFNIRWLKECQRLLKNEGTIWVSGTYHIIFSLGFALQNLGFHILNLITWYKPNASPNLSCRYFAHSTEFIIWASPKRSSKLLHIFNYELMKEMNNGKQMRDLWSIPTPSKSEKIFGSHPTQKPLALLRRIIMASSNPEATVLDPFLGSGTTAVAALELNRKVIGIEKEEEYLKLTIKRIKGIKSCGPRTIILSDSPPKDTPHEIKITQNGFKTTVNEGNPLFQ